MRKKFFRTLIAGLLICVMLGMPVAFAEEATVTGSDVNVRSGPGMNYPVIDCLPKGAQVTVTDRSNPDWYAISYDGVTGYMSSRYLKIAEAPAPTDVQGVKGYINAMYVRFRSGPSSSSTILGEYNKGKALTITGASGDWTACVIDGQAGYVFSQYVTRGEPAYTSDPEPAEEDPGDEDIVIVIGEDEPDEPAPTEPPQEPTPTEPPQEPEPTEPPQEPEPTEPPQEPAPTETPPVEVVEEPEEPEEPTPSGNETEQKQGYINGDYVRFRSGPGTNYSIYGTYNKGKELTITGVSGDWTACVIDGKDGFVFSLYVKEKPAATTPAPSEDPEEPEEPEDPVTPEPSESEPGYITGNNVRFRAGPSMSAEILGEFFYGNEVAITGVSGDWTAIIYEGRSGYVYSQYVARGEYNKPEPPKEPTPGDPVKGQQIADYALQFVGYPYTWGGMDPSTGFDCSGLVYYVYGQFGYSMNRVAADQARNGVHVDPSELQPGDVLCFYSSGSYIGHAGIYIGGNKFVHAANSRTGVIVSELSGYYADRGFEARRIVTG